ncbi:MAG: hypothetical protein R2827_00130 [Bdellovibrionales bacterium]
MKFLIFLTLLLVQTLLIGCDEENIDVEGSEAPNLRTWLSNNSAVANSINLEDAQTPSFFGGATLSETNYVSWSESDKELLDAAFARAWQRLYNSAYTGQDEFEMPMPCSSCITNLMTSPTNTPLTEISENFGKFIYMTYVAHSLAVEIGGAVNWSVAASSSSELHHFFNSRSMMHRKYYDAGFFVGKPAAGAGDMRIKYLGRATPATANFSYRWLVDNNLLKTTQAETINAVLQWFRDNAIHFYGSATYENMVSHWGYPSQPSVYNVARGTIRETESEVQHWTAGCHGTAGFIKSVLKTANIPVEVIYTCGHAQLYFPTIDMYMDHGDNPYSSIVKNQPEKSITGILIDASTYTARFTASPDYIAPGDSKCNYIGQAATDF